MHLVKPVKPDELMAVVRQLAASAAESGHVE